LTRLRAETHSGVQARINTDSKAPEIPFNKIREIRGLFL
jgi:hypothetical protein